MWATTGPSMWATTKARDWPCSPTPWRNYRLNSMSSFWELFYMSWKPKGKMYDDNCREIAPWLARKTGVKVIDWSRALIITSAYFICFLPWVDVWDLVSLSVVLPEMILTFRFPSVLKISWFCYLSFATLNFWGNFEQGMNCISYPALVSPVGQSRHSERCSSCPTVWDLKSRTVLDLGSSSTTLTAFSSRHCCCCLQPRIHFLAEVGTWPLICTVFPEFLPKCGSGFCFSSLPAHLPTPQLHSWTAGSLSELLPFLPWPHSLARHLCVLCGGFESGSAKTVTLGESLNVLVSLCALIKWRWRWWYNLFHWPHGYVMRMKCNNLWKVIFLNHRRLFRCKWWLFLCGFKWRTG